MDQLLQLAFDTQPHAAGIVLRMPDLRISLHRNNTLPALEAFAVHLGPGNIESQLRCRRHAVSGRGIMVLNQFGSLPIG